MARGGGKSQSLTAREHAAYEAGFEAGRTATPTPGERGEDVVYVLEKILKHGHGGGNWRRLVMCALDTARGLPPAQDVRGILAPPSPGDIPGWKYVPVEPTEEMIAAGVAWAEYQPEDNEGLAPNADAHCAKRVYQAMTAASPPLPSVLGGGEEFDDKKRNGN